jgi:hypothetical protein
MSRIAQASLLAALLAALAAALAVSCTKSAGSKDSPKVGNTSPGGAPEVVAVPGAGGERGAVKGANDAALRLKPDEGELSIEVPPDAVAGQETTARVIVTPTPKYKINFEFPTKLSLETPADVTLAKADFKAGGQAKSQGDAEKFEEKKLAFAVKLTPTKSGSHTINGTFKFAVCDKDTCLAKKETIAIQLAAK